MTQHYRDLTLGQIDHLGKLFESVGAGPDFVSKLERRAYLLPRCIEAVQGILDEDKYHAPEMIELNLDGEWQEAGPLRGDLSFQYKALDCKFAEVKLAVALHVGGEIYEEACQEVTVGRINWATIADEVGFKYLEAQKFFVRMPRQIPLYAP